MPALDTPERQYVHSVLNGHTVLFSTVARLYLAQPDPRNWSYANLWGAVSLSHTSGSFYLKIIELPEKSGRVLWEFELER
jgi:Wiskott-Aldrich syndrome protein